MAGASRFTTNAVIALVAQVMGGLNRDGSKPIVRQPGGTEANSFYPRGEDYDTLHKQVSDTMALGGNVILVGGNTSAPEDDLAQIDINELSGNLTVAFEVGNEPYLRKYAIEVQDYIANARDRIANIKKYYPSLPCGVAIMPTRGMKDTNNDEAPAGTPEQQAKREEKLAQKAEAWNSAIIASGIGDFYVQHFYPDGDHIETATEAFAAQRFNKPVYLTETNASGTPEQQAEFYRQFAPVLRTLDWVPVVCWHNGPSGGGAWPVVKVSKDGAVITAFGQAMIDTAIQ
jgi:hypothetical protein